MNHSDTQTAEDVTFTLASFNICSSHFVMGHYTRENLLMLADKIRQSGADIVCLQEVDVGAARSAQTDMPSELSSLTGLDFHTFFQIRPFQGGEYGTALLSRFPILTSNTFHYPVRIATQGTSCGIATVSVKGLGIDVCNTHLSCESDDANTETLACLRQVVTEYRKGSRRAMMICGDFNTSPEKVNPVLSDFSSVHTRAPYLCTYADRTIDHILYTADSVTVTDVRTLDTQYDRTTDHDMLLCQAHIRA